MKSYWYLILGDAFLTLAAIILALILRLEVLYIGYILRGIWPYIMLAMIIRPLMFYITGIYRRIWRYANTEDFIVLGLSVALGSVILALVTVLVLYPHYMYTFPRSLFILEGGISLVLMGGERVALKLLEHYPGDINWRKANLQPTHRALIVGAGFAGVSVRKELASNPQLGLKPVAFLDDDPRKIGRRMQGIPVLGPLVRLPEVAKAHQVDEVIIAIPSAPEQTIQNLKQICRSAEVPYTTMPFVSSFMDRMEDSVQNSSLKLPMALPDITGEEIQTVVRVMQSRNLSIGSQTVTFEKYAAEVAHAQYAIAVTNGTSGLHMCMVAARIQAGDEVITSPFSFVASANCVLYERGKPVFVDIDRETLNLDPAQIESAITEHTKAIIPVHIFGQPADMDPILEVANRHNLPVFEDACEAIGAEYKGRRVGAMGKAGAFAFYPNKQMTTGEGAVLVTNDEDLAHLFRSLRNQGRDQFDSWLTHSRLGFNYRMSEINAAIGVVQMRRLEDLLKMRDDVAQEYNRQLANIPGVSTLVVCAHTTRMSWFVYPVRFDENIDRNQVMAELGKRGIPTRPYFTPIHLQSFYQTRFGFKPGDFPEAEKAGCSVLALPFHGGMKPEQVALVCEALAEVIPLAGRNK